MVPAFQGARVGARLESTSRYERSKIEIGEALRGHMESALTAAVSKFFSNPLESQTVFTRDAHPFRADGSMHVGRGILMHGRALAGAERE